MAIQHPSQVPDTPPEPARETEAERVISWRFIALQVAGCDPINAELVARSGADLHMALSMLKGGCTPGLLAEILI